MADVDWTWIALVRLVVDRQYSPSVAVEVVNQEPMLLLLLLLLWWHVFREFLSTPYHDHDVVNGAE